jgi:hypothetical protein
MADLQGPVLRYSSRQHDYLEEDNRPGQLADFNSFEAPDRPGAPTLLFPYAGQASPWQAERKEIARANVAVLVCK